MNAVNIALNNIKFNISPEILNIAFHEQNEMINTAISIDEMVMSKVIRPRVMVDANLVGGIHLAVNLDYCTIDRISNSEYIITVPKEVTNNRAVMTALSIIPGSAVNIVNTSAGTKGNPALPLAMDMMNNLSNDTVINTTRLELIGDNKILVQDPSMAMSRGILRCVVENDNNMSNLSPRSFPVFSNLVLYAVKAYIYNHLVVKINQGYIWRGHELGIIKDIVDGYADSNETYSDYLINTYQKVAFMNDSDKMSRLTMSMIGNSM